jgi:hypothetical protein
MSMVAHLTSVLAFLLCFCSLGWAADTPPQLAIELVRSTVANELKAEPTNVMFRCRKQYPGGSQTHIYVQTDQATAGMLVAVNDQPLDAAQRHAEESRLDYLISHPNELRRKQKQEKEDQDRVTRIVRAMPEAFTFEYDGTEQGKSGVGSAGDSLVRLKFRPNPDYEPPSRVEQVLTGMQGVLLVDASRHRIAKIDGTLYRQVSFGWGFFGHLDPGSSFQVEQGLVDDGSWQVTRMSLKFTGKILLFKSLVINSDEVFTSFDKVPRTLSFAEAVAILKKQGTASKDRNRAACSPLTSGVHTRTYRQTFFAYCELLDQVFANPIPSSRLVRDGDCPRTGYLDLGFNDVLFPIAL